MFMKGLGLAAMLSCCHVWQLKHWHMQVVLEEEAQERARKDFRKDWLWCGGKLFQEPLTRGISKKKTTAR